MQSFDLAPMSALLRGMTTLLVPLPVVLVGAGAVAPKPTGNILIASGAFTALTYAAVWCLFRPSRFEVGDDGLDIVWPARRARVPRADVASVRTMTAAELRDEVGVGLRIGAGGLWGGFGWLWTTKRGLVSFYISRSDGFVFIERRSGRPLLLTPERPEDFADALRRVAEV